jgi:hypothetical protein
MEKGYGKTCYYPPIELYEEALENTYQR